MHSTDTALQAGIAVQSRRRPWILPVARTWIVLLLVVATISQAGCVRRRMTITSNPPGAIVSIDQQEIGITPVSTDYIYHGTRNFVLVRDGYDTAVGSRTFEPPWYQWPVIEFFTENLWPFELRDERVVHFELIPQQNVGTESLIKRARELRDSAKSGLVVPDAVGTLPPDVEFVPTTSGFAPPPDVITPPQ